MVLIYKRQTNKHAQVKWSERSDNQEAGFFLYYINHIFPYLLNRPKRSLKILESEYNVDQRIVLKHVRMIIDRVEDPPGF